MNRRWLISGALGVLAGMLLPIPTAPALRPAAQPARPVADAPMRSTPISEGASCAPQVSRARDAAEAAIAEARALREALAADWGEPPEQPSSHNAGQAAMVLREALGEVDADLVDVSCEFYPCTVFVIGGGADQRDTVAEAVGVPSGQVGLASVFINDRNQPTAAVAVIDAVALREAESRWVARLLERQASRAAGEYLEALEESEHDEDAVP